VVQYPFGKLPLTPLQPIIDPLWFYDSLSGSGWAATDLFVRAELHYVDGQPFDRLHDDVSPGYAKTPATRPDG
jgi:hypothetical protein